MAYDRFLIAPFNTGLQQNLKPWLIMDDAFTTLENAYVFRGRVRKRFGSVSMGILGQLSSRLRVQVGTLGAPVSPVPGNQFNIGQMFSVGPDLFTVITAGVAQPMLSTNPLANGTFDTTNGAFVIVDPSQIAGTPIFWYPALPVMGIDQYQKGPLNAQPSYAFDTEFAYRYSGGAWARSGTGITPIWHGDNLNFFNVCNWEGITPNVVTMYVTNFNATVPGPLATDDPIWYTQDGNNWTAVIGVNGFYFSPNGGAPHTGPFVQTCRLIISFKNRLLLLNTIENNGSGVNAEYPNRCRFSFNGSPLAQNAWYEPNQQDNTVIVPGTAIVSIGAGAGFIDAATEEQIVSAQFIKDRLIVFFERSTWEIAYTGNDQQPFVFQKINTELGSEAQNSSVPFDKEILTIGNTGVHACNGSNTARIDNKIPDEIFDIKDKNLGVQRVAGIRDYFAEMVYWTFPAEASPSQGGPGINPNFIYPNRILTYNYQNNSWAIFDDCITAFGYWQQDNDITWASSFPLTWEEANFAWGSGEEQAEFRQVIAGNQEGFMFVIRPDITRNAPSLQITTMAISSGILVLKVIDSTINYGEYILIENAIGVTGVNDLIFQVLFIDFAANTIKVEVPVGFSGTYLGGGTITKVSQINIWSKQWNPYDKQGRNISISKIDFAVTNSGFNPITEKGVGQVTVDYFDSSSTSSTLANAEPGSLMCNGILETGPYFGNIRERLQEKLWHPLYLSLDGECIQINIGMTNTQMITPSIALANFELQGLILYCTPTSNRLQ